MQTKIQTANSVDVDQIRQLHESLIQLRGVAIETAHRCGKLLAKAAEQQGELFGEWLSENLPEIPKTRVINLIKLSARELPDLDCVSRQFLLKLADENEGATEAEPSIQTEPHILFVNRICQWFNIRTKKFSVDKWPEADRARLKRELEPLMRIYSSL